MKKLIVLMLIPILAVAVLAGRTGKKLPEAPVPQSAQEQSAPAPKPEEKPAEPAPAQPKEEPAAQPEAPAPAAAAEEEEEENYDTGDASLDDPRNQDGIGEKELLVVSFGTSFNDSRRLTIGAIEQKLAEQFPDWSVRRGFTSQIIIDHVARRDGVIIDNVHDALERAIANGVKILVVQPTHLMDGFEYNDLRDELAGYADAFDRIELGDPLLTIDRDYDMVAETLADATAQYDDGETAIVFMGHGTEAASNAVYAKMQTILSEAGCENYYIGTVEAEPSVEDVLEKVLAGSYKRVVLRPMMIVAGDHANNDMAGDDPDSWKSIFEAAGYEVECVVEGLGQLPMVRMLIADHAAEAIARAEQ
ncbi:MAG: sirohydrochlorin cobaltochelatase [Eubacteriales bacterium]|nr:sirohydrochlorin cobaltochelatase [Eubacteriales bacterium]